MDTRQTVLNEHDAENRSIVTLLDAIVHDAHASGASDIHIDPEYAQIRVRLRIDGSLVDVYTLSIDILPELIARLKVMAGLRTDEHFLPQDGRVSLVIGNVLVDVRISFMRTHYGENAVLRLLSYEQTLLTPSGIGITGPLLGVLSRVLDEARGLILVTGPTGSGKTTTLYTLMRVLQQRPLSLVTIEDPIEYVMPGVRQVQVNPRTSFTIAQGLRSVLRQDPDVIMVGEMRDQETARIAVQAALTGHLVLSTLHTSSAAEALPRLLDMGVEPYAIASTARLVIAQKLIRRVCRVCAAEGVCDLCKSTGYAGRVGSFEYLEVTPSIEEAVMSRARTSEISALSQETSQCTSYE